LLAASTKLVHTYGAATLPAASVSGAPSCATPVITLPVGAAAIVLRIVFCPPPICSSAPALGVPPYPAGFENPSGAAKFFIGNNVGVPACASGPPLKLRSSTNSARPPLVASVSSP
jgi:hypothetical protein